MSTTEKEALEAGTVWWDAELFGGKPDWKKLYSLPKPKLSVKVDHDTFMVNLHTCFGSFCIKPVKAQFNKQ